MNIVGIIPARGGSKGVKNKNILNFHGKPLIGYTLEAALKAVSLDRVVVSTDSKEIADVVRSSYEVEIVKRPEEYARDNSPIEEVLLHVVEYLQKEENYKTDIVVWLQANIPMREEGIVDKVVEKLVNSDADSCVTCYEVDQIPEVMKVINEQGMLVPLFDTPAIRRQELPKRYLLDGSVVALRAQNLFECKGIRKAHVYLGKRVLPVIQKAKRYSLEIDELDDVPLAKFYLKEYVLVKNEL